MKTIINFLLFVLASLILFSCSKGGGEIVPKKEEKKNDIVILTPNPKDAFEAYHDWKSAFVTSEGCPVGKRVVFSDGLSTVSEGMAYGMLAAAYMQDRSLLDDLFAYYDHFKDPYGLMHWKISLRGRVTGSYAATDADEDVAIALILASKKWGNSGPIPYLDKAKAIIDSMMKHTVEAGTYVLKPGDAWGGSATTNPSYFAPAYYKVFYEVTGDSSWLKVADKCYEILDLCMNQQTGLVPDWCKANGSIPADGVAWAREGGIAYTYDACRTPWRIAMDYDWYKDSRALRYCTKTANFATQKGVTTLMDGYYLNGSVAPGSYNAKNAFVGTFACAIAIIPNTNKDALNTFYTRNVAIKNAGYYDESLRLLTLMFLTGNWAKP